MKYSNFFQVLVCLGFIFLFSLAMPSCSKMEMEVEDMIQVAPSEPEEEDKPSKYKDGDLVSMVFTLDDQEQEEVKVSLGDAGTGAAGGDSRRVYWNEGDSVMFVWGPDKEDRCVGVAMLAGDLQTDVKATFNATVFKDAKAVYAVSPASAFYSFTKSANYDKDGTGTVRVDTRVQRGDFGGAYICVARTSLESRKMRFKSMLAYVAVNPTQPAFGGFGLDGGSLKLGGVLPVTASMDGDYTGVLSTGSWEQESAVIRGLTGQVGKKAYLAVKPGTSFANGITFSYYGTGETLVGKATLKKADATVQKGRILEFGSFIDKSMARDYYVKSTADGKGTGLSWESPWNIAQLQAYTIDNTISEVDNLSADAPINIHIAAGEYTMEVVNEMPVLSVEAKYADADKTILRTVNILGGYPSDITTATAATKLRDPENNEVKLISNNLGTYNKDDDKNSFNRNVMRVISPIKCTISGLSFTGNSGIRTGNTALYITRSASKGDIVCLVTHCKFYNNTNTGVGAACAVYVDAVQQTALNDVRLAHCQFYENESGGGSCINFDGTENIATVSHCTFNNNWVKKYSTKQDSGAGIKVSRGSPTIEYCTFTNNYVKSNAQGGGAALWVTDETDGDVLNLDSQVSVRNCHFEGNYTLNDEGKGGAIFLQRHAHVLLEDCSFKNNSCRYAGNTAYGGAIMVGVKNDGSASHPYNDCKMTINRCAFDGNYMTAPAEADTTHWKGGSAICLYQPTGKTSTLIINGGTIKNHTSGSAIQILSGTATINGAIFTGNKAPYTGGGAIQLVGAEETSPSLSVSDCEFVGNLADYGGGAICVSNSGNYAYKEAEKTNLATTVAEAVAFQTCTATLTVENSTFTQNTSKIMGGGAVHAHTSGVVSLSNCAFTENATQTTAWYASGGALSFSYGNTGTGDFSLEKCTFYGNYTQCGQIDKDYGFDAGGAIAVARGTRLHTTTPFSNSTPNPSLVKIFKCSFYNNYSAQAGGLAVMAEEADTYLSHCLFYKNYVKRAIGPAICRFGNCTGWLGINCSTFYFGWTEGGWNSACINLTDGPFVMSHSTVIDTPRWWDSTAQKFKENRLTTDGLIRFDGVEDGSRFHFLNSIICNTRVNGISMCGWASNVELSNDKYPGSGARGYMSVICSPFREAFTEGDDYFSMTFASGTGVGNSTHNDPVYATTDYMNNLKWNCNESAPTYKNSYWSWSGTGKKTSGGSIGKSYIDNMNNDLKNSAPAFHAWLSGLGVLNKDQRGATRGVPGQDKGGLTYPGAYDGNNNDAPANW